ncbi:hypothetical protein [Halomonas sp. BC04]|uniref:hypothetical protein n=1 Tax=Halomonas sp. BC04 TaxID=1403540 RepID=UPI0003ED8A90|nr:hypothetical protein [Halomonas sp. BC04]EWG99270.1 hypothetical protein Q427_25840 [Halomonas sp. BC04]
MRDKPAEQHSNAQDTLKARRQRFKLLALIAIFAIPVATAWIMVEWRIGIPEQRTAHGELAPAVPPLAEWPLVEPLDALEPGDWVLAFDCSTECEVLSDQWWRLHRALGREAPRVSRLRIGGDQPALPGESVAQWAQTPEWLSPGRVWLVDPRGEAVLTYSREVELRDVMDDISHLLRMNPEKRAAPELEVGNR